ncbi:hypothetical protein [Streptomyces sp. NPDC002490]|uniref:hypothetical protein n=1 Tax=Streptomyces sp. NPDC002490 TaxID=3154416 RepID=UPI003322BA98
MTAHRGPLRPLLTALTALVLLAGCGLPDRREDREGSTPAPASVAPKAPVPPGRPLGPGARVPRLTGVDERDPGEVATAWARTAYGHDTAYDTSPQDAQVRAARWLTGRRAAAEREHRPASGPGTRWDEWARHRAWTTVEVTDELVDHAPADSGTTAHRWLVVNGTAHGRDEWKGPGPRLHAYVKLVRSSAGTPWRVDDVAVVEAVTPPGGSARPRAGGPDGSDASAQ